MMALVPVQVENRCHGYVELWMNCLLEQDKAAGGVMVRLRLSVPWVKQVCVLPDESARRERDTASRSRARAVVSTPVSLCSKASLHLSFFLFSQFLSPLLSRTRSLSFAMRQLAGCPDTRKNKDIILWFLNSLTRSASCSWSAGTLVSSELCQPCRVRARIT